MLLHDTLQKVGINTSNLLMDDTVNTTLAFVHTFPDGDREFSFYRNPGADMMLDENDVDPAFIGQTRLFHFERSADPCRRKAFGDEKSCAGGKKIRRVDLV